MKTRQHLRVPLPLPVKIRVVDEDEDYRLTRIDDISWGGAFVVMDPPAPKDSRVVLQFAFSDTSVSLELWGTVVRSKQAEGEFPAGVGVEFDTLDNDAQSLIQSLVDEEVRALLKNS
jgi:c-di-GMP-binding flagellar brake protein YcgR